MYVPYGVQSSDSTSDQAHGEKPEDSEAGNSSCSSELSTQGLSSLDHVSLELQRCLLESLGLSIAARSSQHWVEIHPGLNCTNALAFQRGSREVRWELAAEEVKNLLPRRGWALHRGPLRRR